MTGEKNINQHYRDAEELGPTDDQRQEYRLTGRIWVYVEIEAADGAQGGRSLRCSSSDISANGLRVNSSECLWEGAILPLTIYLEESEFHLMGEVKWCFPAEGQAGTGYVAGFALYESDQTSIVEWKKAIVRLLSN